MVTYPESSGEVHVTAQSAAVIYTSTETQAGYRCRVKIETNHSGTYILQDVVGGIVSDLVQFGPIEDTAPEFTVYPRGYLRVYEVNNESIDDANQLSQVYLYRETSEASVMYCSPEEVQGFLSSVNILSAGYTLTDNTTPTRADVERMIRSKMDYIDEYCHRSWNSRIVTREYHDYDEPLYSPPGRRHRERCKIYLEYYPVRTLSAGEGDKIEVWDGSQWLDYVDSKTEGRGSDYWLNYEDGILYFVSSRPAFNEDSVRVTYRYGEEYVPDDVKEAAIKLVAADLATTSDHSDLIADDVGGGMTRLYEKARLFRSQAYAILDQHRKFEGGKR